MSNRITQNLAANVPLTHPRGGRLFLLENAGPAAAVDLVMMSQGNPTRRFNGVGKGFRIYLPNDVRPFTGIQLTSAQAGNVTFIIDDEDVQISMTNGVLVENPAANPVYVRTITAENTVQAQGSNFSINYPNVNVDAAAESLVLAQSMAWKGVTLRADAGNAGVIALGATGIVVATAAIKLAANEVFRLGPSEAGAALYGRATVAGQKIHIFATYG